MKVKRTVLPGNTFWNNWIGYPFSATEWNMRPLGVQVYALAYRTGGPWNETGFAARSSTSCSTRRCAIADPDAAPRADGADGEDPAGFAASSSSPTGATTFRHMTEDVHGLVMHPTFEIHLERTWLDA